MAWLCNHATNPAQVTTANLGKIKNSISEWLEWYAGLKGILPAMRHIAGLGDVQKDNIKAWFGNSLRVQQHFDIAVGLPVTWPSERGEDETSKFLKKLLGGFYSLAFSKARGLPYDEFGQPANPGLRREIYVKHFRELNYGRVCPGCDGDMDAGGEEFDHWIGKAPYPSLSVSHRNLVLFCHKCNSAGMKGQKPTYDQCATPFADWFHPWLRPAVGKFEITVNLGKVIFTPIGPIYPPDANRVRSLDSLLNLTDRWEIELNSQEDDCRRTLDALLEEDGHLDEENGTHALQVEQKKARMSVTKKPFSLVRKALLDDVFANPSTIRAWIDEVRNTIQERDNP